MAFQQLIEGDAIQNTPLACVVDITPPTFAGITSLTPDANGSLQATWGLATDAVSPPVRYRVYIQEASEDVSQLFTLERQQGSTHNLFGAIYTDHAGDPLLQGVLYRVGVRAVDAVGNESQNTNYMEAVSLGVLTDGIMELLRAVRGVLAAQVANTSSLVIDNQVESKVESNQVESKVSLQPEIDC